jgi:AraC-like DNA-binding protein
MVLKRAPRPALRPFVEVLWATDETAEGGAVTRRREHVLPSGLMHIAIRLSGDGLRLFKDPHDRSGWLAGEAVVGGARDSYYIRDVSGPLCSVGAQLRPGAALALFDVPADQLAGRHTRLEDLWGRRTASLREQLAEIGSLPERLDALETVLAEWLPRARGLHPGIAQALDRIGAPQRPLPSVHEMVRQSGYSHRKFISLFHQAVGLTPKLYCRVLRFQRVLGQLSAGSPAWLDVALTAGYSDQAHFNREFREFSGVTPTGYGQGAPKFPHHLPVDTSDS